MCVRASADAWPCLLARVICHTLCWNGAVSWLFDNYNINRSIKCGLHVSSTTGLFETPYVCSFKTCRTACWCKWRKVLLKLLRGVWFGFDDVWAGMSRRCNDEEPVTPFWSNRGQEAAMELLIRRVNEDGWCWIDRVGEEEKLGDF